jgi:polar amino acid transport system permease protein
MDQITTFVESFFNLEYMLKVVPEILVYGLWNTLYLSIAATVFGILGGLVLAAMGVSRIAFVRFLARVYTDIFRGLPAILTILLLGQGLAPFFNPWTQGNPYPLGILALSVIASAYIGEIFRSGIQSIDRGQLEASRALGMSYGAAMFLVVIPQGIRRVLPALVNQFIGIVKDSSLVYFLGLLTEQRELFRIGQDAAVTNANLSPLVMAGIFYLIITVPLTHLVNFIDKQLRQGKRAVDTTNADEPTSTTDIPVQTRTNTEAAKK